MCTTSCLPASDAATELIGLLPSAFAVALAALEVDAGLPAGVALSIGEPAAAA